MSELNKELQTKTLLQLAETDRLRHTEHQLHASESKVERLNNENIKLRLKIDDLRMKLQSRKYEHFSRAFIKKYYIVSNSDWFAVLYVSV